jgi:hypothetical protein
MLSFANLNAILVNDVILSVILPIASMLNVMALARIYDEKHFTIVIHFLLKQSYKPYIK